MNRTSVTLLLADYAEVVGGKLYIMGGGWSVTGPDPSTHGLAIKIALPWDQANMRKQWAMKLLTDDGVAVELPTPVGDQHVEIGGEFEAGRPPGISPGTPLDVMLAFNIGPLPLPPGGRFAWAFSIDGDSEEGWYLPFQTRSAPAGPTGP